MAPALKKVKQYLASYGLADRVCEFAESSATVEQAAHVLQTEPARIAKTISLRREAGCVLVVTSGDTKIDNAKYKKTFSQRPKMLSAAEVEPLTGYRIGGVCPFCCAENARVYLDVSLRRFDTVYPAAGTANSAVRLSCEELEEASGAAGWVDVCRPAVKPAEAQP